MTRPHNYSSLFFSFLFSFYPPLSSALMVSVNAVSLPLAWFLMYPAGLGFKGGPIALSLANVVQALLLAALAKRWLPYADAW
jgi:Na+-driven multidrug efflux pump